MSLPDSSSETDIREESLHLLEFHLVRARLARYATFEPARELALSLTPSYDADQVAQRQEETSEARRFLDRSSTLDLSLARDIRLVLQRAALGGILSGEELRQVGDTASASRLARAALARQRDLPRLGSLAHQLPDLRVLEDEMDAAISGAGELLDSASPALKRLRSDVREAYQHLNDALQRTMRRLQRQGVLQEPVITERNGRMVLLVKADMRGQIRGIVHDVSDSGATVFAEPLSAVPLGNTWRELRLAVEREEERILMGLSHLVSALADDLTSAVELLAELDLAMAKARYSQSLKAYSPTVMEGERPYVRLIDVRHPLLGGEVVPISVTVGHSQPVLLITGPNAGGKTVALKTVGLTVLMAQAGLHIPAKEAALSLFDGVYCDIGDQQSIERSLSTFSSHIHILRAIIGQATSASLVLLDELGTSTDPEEGAALAKAVLSHFAQTGVSAIATSHYRDVAAFVQQAPDMLNASVELDPHTLEPTYRLTVGLPGRSYALAIAARHGLDDAILQQANSLLAPTQEGTERLLRELQEERHLAEELRRQAEELRRQAEEAQAEAREQSARLEEQLASIEDQKVEMLEETRIQLQERSEALLRQLQKAERALAEAPKSVFAAEPRPQAPETPQAEPEPEEAPPTLKEGVEEVSQVQEEMEAPQWQPPARSRRADWLAQLRPGDRVYLRGIPQPVEVITPPEGGTTLEVLLGTMRAKLPVYQVVRPAEVYKPAALHGVYMAPLARREVKTDLDLRGQRVEDALGMVETLLDEASLAGTFALRIIHGVGSGALRTAIRDYLSRHPQVKSFRRDESTAVDGATIVELA